MKRAALAAMADGECTKEIAQHHLSSFLFSFSFSSSVE